MDEVHISETQNLNAITQIQDINNYREEELEKTRNELKTQINKVMTVSKAHDTLKRKHDDLENEHNLLETNLVKTNEKMTFLLQKVASMDSKQKTADAKIAELEKFKFLNLVEKISTDEIKVTTTSWTDLFHVVLKKPGLKLILVSIVYSSASENSHPGFRLVDVNGDLNSISPSNSRIVTHFSADPAYSKNSTENFITASYSIISQCSGFVKIQGIVNSNNGICLNGLPNGVNAFYNHKSQSTLTVIDLD